MADDPNLIFANDYNLIQSKVAQVLGTGSSSFGYGQTPRSSQIPATSPKPVITKEQWDNLRYDITNIKLHQTGVLPLIKTVTTSDAIKIGAAEPNFQYDELINQARTSRFDIGSGRFSLTVKDTKTRTASWSVAVSAEITITFGTVDQARFFFNSGGKVRISSSRSGGSSSAQNTSWTNLLEAVGSVDFGGAVPSGLNFYSLTNSYQPYYSNSPSSPYGNNIFKLEAKCNVSNNSSGTANIVYIKCTWTDGYRDLGPSGFPPPDLVDGTLSVSATELKATGVLLPEDDEIEFTITSPTISISAISGS